ncbi:MAG: hypothetical protein HY709_06460 [Candidatus Latescibacteria bacterium]|nr:hypothetical protein [Candidatus Latescibacterota bacterium]
MENPHLPDSLKLEEGVSRGDTQENARLSTHSMIERSQVEVYVAGKRNDEEVYNG